MDFNRLSKDEKHVLLSALESLGNENLRCVSKLAKNASIDYDNPGMIDGMIETLKEAKLAHDMYIRITHIN